VEMTMRRSIFAAFLVAVAATQAGAQTRPATTRPATTRPATTRASPATQPTGLAEAEIMAQVAGLELYSPTRPQIGKIRVLGTSPFTHLLHNWAAEYKRLQPGVSFDIHPGSSDAP